MNGSYAGHGIHGQRRDIPRGLLPCAAAALSSAIAISFDLTSHADASDGYAGLVAVARQLAAAAPAHDRTIFIALVAAAIAVLAWLARSHASVRAVGHAAPLGILAAFAIVIGQTFSAGADPRDLFADGVQAFKTIASFVGWSFTATCLFADAIVGAKTLGRRAARTEGEDKRRQTAVRRSGITAFYDAHPLLSTIITLLACWLPFYVGFAPGLLMGDTPYMILPWFGLGPFSDWMEPIDPNVFVTQQHPIVYQAFLAGCVKLGIAVSGSADIGYAIYTYAQVALTIASLACAQASLRRLGVALPARVVTLLVVALVPVFPLFAMLGTKDVLFADALLLLVVLVTGKAVRQAPLGWGYLLRVSLLALLVALLRKGGWVMSAGALAAILLCGERGARWRAALSAAAVLGTVFLVNNVLWPGLGFTPASSREAHSIPFQQTARYVAEFPDDVTDEERAAIDAVLGYDDLAERYNPDTSDPVKNAAVSVDGSVMPAYWHAWTEMGLMHPDCYFWAYANNYYEYLYLGDWNADSYTLEFSEAQMDIANEQAAWGGLDLSFHPAAESNAVCAFFADLASAHQTGFGEAPVLLALETSPTYVWLLLLVTACLLCFRRRRELAALLPLWLVFLVCLAGPTNGYYFRYAYPLVIGMLYAAPALLLSRHAVRPATGGAQRGRHSAPTPAKRAAAPAGRRPRYGAHSAGRHGMRRPTPRRPTPRRRS